MQKMEAKFGVVFVAAAGNDGTEINSYPQLVSDKMVGMLVVGATRLDGYPYTMNSFHEVVNAMAPGVSLPLPPNDVFLRQDATGTSFGTLYLSFGLHFAHFVGYLLINF